MRRNAVTVCVLLAVASGACKKEGNPPATDAAARLDTTAAADTGAMAPAPQTPAAQSQAAPSRIETASPPPVTTAAVQDVPYVSDDTGTVAPGMSEAEVLAMWGTPVARSRTGALRRAVSVCLMSGETRCTRRRRAPRRFVRLFLGQ